MAQHRLHFSHDSQVLLKRAGKKWQVQPQKIPHHPLCLGLARPQLIIPPSILAANEALENGQMTTFALQCVPSKTAAHIHCIWGACGALLWGPDGPRWIRLSS